MYLHLLDLVDADFPEMVAAQWEAFETPYQGILHAVCPIFDNDRAASLADNTQRQLKEHREAGSASHWVKVVDVDAGNKIVGAARWLVYEKNPFTEASGDRDRDSGPVADWFLENSVEREYVSRLIAQIGAGRMKFARRPHLCIQLMHRTLDLYSAFTIPKYRCAGVGTLLTQWGLEKADNMGLECWLEASRMGYGLYKSNGFNPVCELPLDPSMPDNLSKEDQAALKRLRGLIQPPVHYTLMWRPRGGQYTEGVTVKLWEAESDSD
ncbi:hypothetical protein PRK78_000030 [Emydomyces testavorans]|uniref:N-acetyltransferase domain-containing protein n=1 Tax=Emydomyces testavorans TaxID=2070801 RepID=A0AAF0IE17_9EURO|nr:hypothetical protein PRK78_000030 [Emydomyces testavorans]